MTLWLLNHFSTQALIILIVGGTTAVALIAALILRKAFPNMAEAGFEEVTGVLRGGRVRIALHHRPGPRDRRSIRQLCRGVLDGVVGVERPRRADPCRPGIPGGRPGPHESGDRPVRPCRRRRRVAGHESGERSPRAAAALEGLYAVYRSFEPQGAAQEAFYATSVDKLSDISLSRRQRLQQSQEGLSPLLRILLVA